MNKKKIKINRSGLSLVEIIISTLIFVMATAGLIGLFSSTKRHTLRSRSLMVQGELGRYFLEQLHKQVRQDQWGTNCLSSDGTDTNCGAYTVINIDGVNYTPEFIKSEVPGVRIRKVKLTISYPVETYDVY